MSTLLRRAAVAVMGLLLAGTASAQESADFRSVQKWAVSYDDLTLGLVEGVAYCDWEKRHCRLQDLLPTSALGAIFTDRAVDLPFTSDGPIVIRLGPELAGAGPHGPWPSKQGPSRVTPEHRIGGTDGGPGKITIKNGDTEVSIDAPVRATAIADYDEVSFLLRQGSDGTLSGEWRYLADPVTQRHGDGSGPVGIVEMVRDDDPAITGVQNRPGGLRAVAHGGAVWRPLPPRIFAVHVLEDQAAFENGAPKYTHARLAEQTRAPLPGAPGDAPQTTAVLPQKNLRTLVIFGQDLPLAFWDKDKSITPIGERADALRYEILAVSYGGQDKGETRFERARRAVIDAARRNHKPGMTATEEYAFRHLDAALVQVSLNDADPGEKRLAWGQATGIWDLQYGDNTADLRFIRLLNGTETESVPEIALPEHVVLEVEVGSRIADDQLPIVLSYGAGLGAGTLKLTATRSADRPTIYRTPPILFVDEADQARAAGIGGPRLSPAKGDRVVASLDRDKTHFLRASVAVAVAGKPSGLWLAALQQAAKCGGATLNAADWPSLARQPAETVSWTGGLVSGRNDVAISYGDHAAMIILRNSFLQVMKSQLAELDAIKSDDRLVEAWYRSMQPVVTQIPDYPLAVFAVASPVGQVPFARAYADDFADSAFQRGSTADGERRYRAWRLEATRAALGFFRAKMVAAMTEAEGIAICNRRDLLRLTGSGFKHVAARITPLLMKYRTPAQEGYRADRDLAEPDALARGYVNNLDTLGAAVAAVRELSTLTNTAAVATALVLIAPAAGIVWNEGIGALAGVVGGLAVYGYDTAWQIQQTYREHVEVELGFGSVPALGFERYFDAAARSTPWWQTGAIIFADTALQVAAIRSASKPIAEGLSAWRGAALVEKLDRGGWAALKQLSIEEQRDVALFLLTEEERAARTSIFGRIRALAHRVFVRLGRQAAGESAPVASEAATALDEEALEGAQGLPTEKPPADKLRPLKDMGAEGDLAARGRAEIGAAALEEAEQEGKAAVSVGAAEVKVRKAWPVFTGAPEPGVPFRREINGNWITFEIEEFLDNGEFFYVYKLKQPPPGIDLKRLGDKLVLKILRPDITAFTHIPEVRTGVLARMIRARDLLRSAGIGQADFEAFEEVNVIVQKEVKWERGKVEKFVKGADKAKRLAVLKLYKQLIAKDLVWLDGHANNLYLENVQGQGWVAKILDQDMICRFSEMNEGIYQKWLDYVRSDAKFFSRAEATGLLNPDASVRDFMITMLEYKGWIDFSYTTKHYLPTYLLEEQDIWDVFPDLPFEKPALPKHGSIVPLPAQARYAANSSRPLQNIREYPLAA